MPYDTLTLHHDGVIAEIRLESEATRSPRFLDEIGRVAAVLHDDASVRAVLLTAPAGGFAAEPATDTVTRADQSVLPFRCLELLRQPVVACIEGAVNGIGLELLVTCDIRLAAEGATFAITAIASGRIPAAGATQRLPRLIGKARATEMLLLGGTIDAGTALNWGLVNDVLPRDGVRARANDLAQTIAARGPIAVAYAKEAILRGLDMPLEHALRYETDLTILLQTTADRAEGVSAFLEKRPPEFEGH